MSPANSDKTVRMLLIDDDRELCELLTAYLRPAGFDVDVAYDAEQGLQRALSGEHEYLRHYKCSRNLHFHVSHEMRSTSRLDSRFDAEF